MRKDGSHKIISFNGRIGYDKEGNFQRTHCIFADITERIKYEQHLRESEEKFRRIFNSIPDLFFLVSEDGTYLDYRGIKSDLYALPEEFLGKKIVEVMPKDIGLLQLDAIKKVLKTQEPQIIEFSIPMKEEQKFYEARFLYFSNNQIAVFARDITERKRAEQELVILNKLKSELLTRASHELKTPLMSIKGFTELLLHKHKATLHDDELYLVSEITKGCFRLETLINDILKTADLESGSVHLTKSENDLSLLIRTCVEDLKGLADTRNHIINLIVHDKLKINSEKKQISQALNNILINAIKYTPPNGRIEILSEVQGDSVKISIKDTGIGFTEQEKKQLFKRFGKIERFGQGFNVISEGSGLGLYISKKIIELHGGDIWVESDGRNEGSTFYFSLPIIKNDFL